jgi:hypothetical protein
MRDVKSSSCLSADMAKVRRRVLDPPVGPAREIITCCRYAVKRPWLARFVLRRIRHQLHRDRPGKLVKRRRSIELLRFRAKDTPMRMIADGTKPWPGAHQGREETGQS